MKLSMEEVKQLRAATTHGTCWTEDTDCRNCASLPMCNAVRNLIDTIEAQHDEIELLRNQMIQAARGSAGIVDLAEENVRLMAQTAAMREVIIELKPSCGLCNPENCSNDCGNIRLFEMIDAALSSDAGKDYHNPADVEALKVAKDALKIVSKKHSDLPHHEKYPRTSIVCSDAIKAIDKALGGDTP